MELRNMLISILLFSAVIIGLNNYMLDLSSNFSQDIDDLSMLSQAQAIEAQTNELREAFSTKITGTLLDVPLVLVKGSIEFLQLITLSLFGFWDSFINSISTYLFLPTWFTSIVASIIVIMIIFEGYSIISKWRT